MKPARLYGLQKIHKVNHPLRPICSSVNSYNYELASELADILSPYSSNSFTIKNTFTFVKEINELTPNQYHICSFDVSSLFTCIPLDKTIDIAIEYTFKSTEKVQGLSINKLLQMATKETNFMEGYTIKLKELPWNRLLLRYSLTFSCVGLRTNRSIHFKNSTHTDSTHLIDQSIFKHNSWESTKSICLTQRGVCKHHHHAFLT